MYTSPQKSRGAVGYFANVVHKFNLKLGGINHVLLPGDLAAIPKSTMVVGIDVAHPALGSIENAPSVVGMVASVDEHYANWPGSVRIQKSRQEIQKDRRESLEKKEYGPRDGLEDMVIPSNLASLISERLRPYYQKNNNTLPENILIYRDGKSSVALNGYSELT